MINDLKKNIMKYITGNITPEQEKGNQFRGNEETNYDLIERLTEKGFTSSNYSILTTTTTSNYLVYGGDTINGESKGFIAVLDQSGNVLDLITQYDSGVDLQWILYLDYDENGLIYGIDEAPNYPHNLRIILLNNVALETPRGYFCKLRTSYYINQSNYDLPSADKFDIARQDLSVPHHIRKVPGEPVYFICGNIGSKFGLIKFVNNVGIPNEWYVYRGEDIGTNMLYKVDMQVEKVNDDYRAYIYYTDIEQKTMRYQQFNGTSLVNYQDFTMNDPIMSIRVADKDTSYFTTRHNNGDGTYSMSLYEVEKGIITTISGFTFTTQLPSFYLCIEGGILYGMAKGLRGSGGLAYYDIKLIAYSNGESVVSEQISFEVDSSMTYNTAVQSSFALHKFIVLSNTKVYHPAVVIYDNMYSGEEYENYGIASTRKGELYTTGNNIVFARGLYNKQIYNNQTTSTIEIPNGYLNDTTITQENILSKDNNILVSESETINKNIYETLFLNFTHTLSVIDEDDEITYPGTANYINLNTNIGEEENYNNTFLGKLRIRYEDHVVVQQITWEKIDNTHYQMTTIIDNTTPIESLEFISNDEETIYMTKTNFELIGNYFKLTQKIRID